MAKSHVIVARSPARFEDVVNGLRQIGEASSVHVEYFTGPKRAAVFIGEKLFLRTSSWASSVTIVKETDSGVIVRVIATAGGGGLLNIGYGANKAYARDIIKNLKRFVPLEVVREVDEYNLSKWGQVFLPGEV